MLIDRIRDLLASSSDQARNFPATELYNEGWMLRLVLDWLSCNPGIEHELAFYPNDKWYSEALLPSKFLRHKNKLKLAESWTHVDGVIGDFTIGNKQKGDLSLTEGASRILVTEAKIFSKLSSGVKNARYFNQAARNVACIAEVIHRSKIPLSDFTHIGFYVLAPEKQIRKGIFSEYMIPKEIEKTVQHRVSEYCQSEKNTWFEEWFKPTMNRIRISEISWEELIDLMKVHDPSTGIELNEFYVNCLKYN